MKKYIRLESEVKETVEKLTERQRKNNIFLNITVKPYKGQYSPEETNGERLFTITEG